MKTVDQRRFTGRRGWASLRAGATCVVLLLPFVPLQAAQRQVVHTYVPQLTSGLAPQGQLDTSQQLHLTLGLPLRDPTGLETLLQTIYDPSSPNFRQWQTPQQLAERFGATEKELQTIADWAAANGLSISRTHTNRLVIELDGSVADVQKALNVVINQYKEPVSNRLFFAPDREPSLALEVRIQTINGLDNCAVATSHVKVPTKEEAAAIRAARETLKPLPPPPASTTDATAVPAGVTPLAGSGPGGNYAGCDFRAAYAPGVELNGAGQSVGLLQFDNYYLADIRRYETNFGLPNVPLVTVPITASDPPAPGGGNVETSLDIEMAIAMAPGLSAVYVYETGSAANYTAMLSRMQSDNFSRQLSSSWSINFAGNPHAYIAPDPTVESIFQLMAAQGQSFFQASGDFDAWTNSGAVYFPWPMDSINITLVGGTTLSTAGPCGARSSEVVWNWGGGTGSSGGISTYYNIPWWQQSTPMGSPLGSGSKRNIPDVALTADGIYVTANNGGSYTGVGGTSCAAPLWAGFMALVNQQAMGAGRAPVGFLNPSAYIIGNSASFLNAFNDVTAGNNYWAASPTHFPAVAGYDLCTGWGTPKGQTLINLLAGDPTAPSLVANGGFETGDFTSWTVGGGGSVSSSYDHSGVYGAAEGPVGSTNTLTQTVSTTPGQTYLFSFWLYNGGSGTGIDFKAKWNGVTLMEIANPGSSFGYTRYEFQVLAAGSSATIEFDFRNDPSFWGLDDVGVTAAPQILAEVVNPGFETGTFASWTQGGNTAYTVVSPSYAHLGQFGAQMGPTATLGTLSQIIQTVPGQQYIFSFWLENPYGGTGTEFKALWNGSAFMDIVDSPATGWSKRQFTVTATGLTTAIEFDFRNDPGYWGLDDICVSPIYTYQGLTFDDLPPTPTSASVPNMYAGVMWYNLYYLDGDHYSGNPSGYGAGVVSPVNVAFNGGGSPAAISNAVPFNLNSAMLTAAWNDNLQVQVIGLLHGAQLYNNTYILSAVSPTLINFNYRGVTEVRFISSGGTPHPGYGGSGTHFVIDNVILTTLQGLTFDDLPVTTDSAVPDGYGALQWSANFHYFDGTHYAGNPSGYAAGAMSRDSIGYNAFGAPVSVISAVPFNFDSAYITGAWNDGLQVNAKGYYHGALIYNQTYTVNATIPMLINFNFANVTEVDFTSSGGTVHPGYGGSGTHFVIDNITTSFPTPQFDAAYLRSSVGEPWGTTDSDTAMNRIFGTNHWQDLRYQTVSPTVVFNPATHFVYMEGSDDNWNDMFAFLNANRSLVESWVVDGGNLFINAAPNQGNGGMLAFNVQLNYTNPGPFSSTGTAVDPTNPIFNGPFTPVGTSWTASYFAHASVLGDGGLMPLITGSGGVLLGELWPGLGHALFGSMTEATFHSPQPQGYNLLGNIIAYTGGARGTLADQGTFDDLGTGGTVPNGYLGVNWNNFSYFNGITYGGNPSGYQAGVISVSNVAYNPFGNPASITSPNPFDLHSAYLTAAWNDNLQLRAQGYSRGNLVYDQTYTLQATMPTLINFDFLGVTEVDFTPSGGTPHLPYGTGSATHFAMDNVLLSTGDTVASGIDHFVWSPIPVAQSTNCPFAVTLVAKDANNNTVTTFGGTVAFTARTGVRDVEPFNTGGWPHAPWVAVGAAYGATSPTYAHDGAAGFSDALAGGGANDWYYRTDVSVGAAGDTLSWWVRPGIGQGRAYLGFAAGAGGTWAAVVAPNTSQFIIQRDIPYGTFVDYVAEDQTWLPGKWYKVSVLFNSPNSVTASLYDSDGVTLLHSLTCNAITGAPAGVAIRCFNGFSVDTVRVSNAAAFPIAPTVSGNFVSGVWNGTFSLPIAGANIVITATEGLRGVAGSSNPFQGTLPIAPPWLTVTPVAGGVNVCWTTCAGHNYQLQRKNGNLLNAWSNATGIINATGANICVFVSMPPPAYDFFQVVLLP